MTKDYPIPTPRLEAMLDDVESASDWISHVTDDFNRRCSPKLAAVVRIALKSLENARSYLMGRANRGGDYDTDMDVHDDICESIHEMEQIAKGVL